MTRDVAPTAFMTRRVEVARPVAPSSGEPIMRTAAHRDAEVPSASSQRASDIRGAIIRTALASPGRYRY